MSAFIKFNRGVLKMPLLWQAWLAALVAANLVVPMFFLPRLEAWVVLGTMMASMALMLYLTGRFGFTRILGLGHILWIPLLAFLLASCGAIYAGGAFGLWIRTLIVLNSVSLIIDAVDVIRYLAGDRKETVAGL